MPDDNVLSSRVESKDFASLPVIHHGQLLATWSGQQQCNELMTPPDGNTSLADAVTLATAVPFVQECMQCVTSNACIEHNGHSLSHLLVQTYTMFLLVQRRTYTRAHGCISTFWEPMNTIMLEESVVFNTVFY
jgi:hypothetical protein